jgi:hypothetical protein
MQFSRRRFVFTGLGAGFGSALTIFGRSFILNHAFPEVHFDLWARIRFYEPLK